MKSVAVLVLGNVRETLRERLLAGLLATGGLVLFALMLVAPLALGARVKTFHDVGLAWIHLSGMLILLVLGAWTLHRERERGIWLTVLTRPVARHEYLLGRFLGLVATLALTILASATIYVLIGLLVGLEPLPGLAVGLLYTFLEMSLLAGLLLFFSTFCGFGMTVFFSLAVFFAGHLSGDLLRMGELGASVALGVALRFAHALLPNMEIFRIREGLVSGALPARAEILQAVGYTVLYLSALCSLSFATFARKEIR